MRFIHRTLDRVEVPRVPVPITPDFRLALAGLVAAIGCLVASAFGNPSLANANPLHDQVLAYAGAVGFLVLGGFTVRTFGREMQRVLAARTSASHANIVRWIILLVGFVLVILTFLDLIQIRAIHQLLVGSAITGIVLGVAAQNSLSNIFAGIVLLLARPFNVGDRIRVRSGAMGGEMVGAVTGMGLTYVTLLTDDGALSLPNAGVLAAAVGPAPRPEPAADADGVQNRQTMAGLRSGA